MIHATFRPLWLPLALVLSCTSCWRADVKSRIVPISEGYSSTKVNTPIFRHHAILTFGQRQFVGFYAPDGTVTIAEREITSPSWKIHQTDWKANVRDAHNSISLGVSSDGILHISYDHHGHPLRYRRTERPLDPSSFGEIIGMTGRREGRVTYPQFVNLADGTLLFVYRDGGSGNGDLCINRYDVSSKSWDVLHHPLISGGGTHNAYWCRPAVGSDGSLKLAWCWRRTGDASTNSRICYAQSPDGGLTWENSRGERYLLPITQENNEVIDPVSEGSNLSNQDSSEVDSLNRMHIVCRKNDADGIPQFWHIWFDGSNWQQNQVSQFTERHDMKGGGTLRNPLSRPDLFIDKKDNVYVLYRYATEGSRPMVARGCSPDYTEWKHFSLADINLLQWEPNYDILRWKRDGILNLFLLPADQGNHETTTEQEPQMASVLEWKPR